MAKERHHGIAIPNASKQHPKQKDASSLVPILGVSALEVLHRPFRYDVETGLGAVGGLCGVDSGAGETVLEPAVERGAAG